LRKQGDPLLLLDSGNILFERLDRKHLLGQDAQSATAITEIYANLGYDAMAVGPHDLAYGPELLTESFLAGTPWISANLLTLSGKPLLPPWIIRDVQESRVGILGLTAATTMAEDYHIASWQEILPQYVEELSIRCDFIILLSSLDQTANEAIADTYPQINLILTADPQAGNTVPHLHRNTLFSQSHSRGKYLGIMQIDWPDTGVWKGAIEGNASIIPQLRSYYEKTTRDADDLTSSEIGKLQRKLEWLGRLQDDVSPSARGIYSFTFQSLSSHIKSDMLVHERIQRLKQEISKGSRQGSAPGKQ